MEVKGKEGEGRGRKTKMNGRKKGMGREIR